MNRPDGTTAIDLRSLAHGLGAVALVLVVAVVVAAAIPGLVGADQSYVVQSDSMAPSIEAGDVVFVSGTDAGSVAAGDVITYERGDGPTVTHRVVEVVERDGDTAFRTKGDANDVPDSTLVPSSAVVGTVSFHVPMVGYLVSFAQTNFGILALIVVPSGLLVVDEVRTLYGAADPNPGGDEA